MINSGMMICSFFLKKSHSRGFEKVYQLNHEYGYEKEDDVISYVDFFDMLKEFCQKYSYNINDDKKMKTFSIPQGAIKEIKRETVRVVACTVVSGAYGIESDLTDSNTNEVLFHRDTHIADNKRFNVVVYIPKDQGETEVSKGIIIFQSIGTYGVKMHTVKMLKSFFSELGLTFETRSISVRAFVEKLIDQGSLYRLTLIKNKVSPDSSDRILINTGREETSYIEPVLKPTWLNKLLVFFDRMDKDGIYEIDGEEFEDIKVQFKLGGRTRTARLRNIDRFSVVEDFPDTIFNNGKYNRDVLITYMIETAEAYKEKMVFTVGDEG